MNPYNRGFDAVFSIQVRFAAQCPSLMSRLPANVSVKNHYANIGDEYTTVKMKMMMTIMMNGSVDQLHVPVARPRSWLQRLQTTDADQY